MTAARFTRLSGAGVAGWGLLRGYECSKPTFLLFVIQNPFHADPMLIWNRAPRLTSERTRMMPVDGSLDFLASGFSEP